MLWARPSSTPPVINRDGNDTMTSASAIDQAGGTALGLSRSEIKRCIKRYLARELYPLIVASLTG